MRSARTLKRFGALFEGNECIARARDEIENREKRTAALRLEERRVISIVTGAAELFKSCESVSLFPWA